MVLCVRDLEAEFGGRSRVRLSDPCIQTRAMPLAGCQSVPSPSPLLVFTWRDNGPGARVVGPAVPLAPLVRLGGMSWGQ